MHCVPSWLPFNHTLNKSLFVISIADYLFWGNVYRQPLEGLLNKYTNVMKGWQFRWFVLDPVSGVLEYFEVCCIVYYLPLLIIFEMAVWDTHMMLFFICLWQTENIIWTVFLFLFINTVYLNVVMHNINYTHISVVCTLYSVHQCCFLLINIKVISTNNCVLCLKWFLTVIISIKSTSAHIL